MKQTKQLKAAITAASEAMIPGNAAHENPDKLRPIIADLLEHVSDLIATVDVLELEISYLEGWLETEKNKVAKAPAVDGQETAP